MEVVDALPIPEQPEPVDMWWDVELPDFSDNVSRPVISLIGEKTIILSLGESYEEEGATVADLEDGDISASIHFEGQVNSNTIGDYLIRYSITDEDGLSAIEQTRLVRVMDTTTAMLSRRPLGSTMSNFGYLEYLPSDYGKQENQKPPLLIYIHGFGGNAQFADTNPTLALDTVIGNYGIPKLIEDGEWDGELPFVVLAPQIGSVPGSGRKLITDRIDAFVEYAKNYILYRSCKNLYGGMEPRRFYEL